MFPYKVGESSSFADVLKLQLERKSKHYEKWSNDIQVLDKLRSSVLCLENNEYLATALLKYYTQLMTAAVKFDLSLMNWPWYNAFGKEKKLTIGASVSFEKSAVLFNLAILYANVGVERVLNGKADEEGLKKAAHLFSQSAGVISYLELKVKEEGLGAKGSSQLRALLSLMMGMGQECFVLKAIKAGTKDSIIAKLAASAANLFYDSHQICVEESTDFDKDDMAHCFAKAELNSARAHFYKGNDDASNAKYGEQIARFEASLRICKDALGSKQAKQMSNHHINDFKNLESFLLASIPKLRKDNELIYMETTPKEETLSEIQPAQLVKEVPFPSLAILLESHGPALFDKLIPFSIRDAIEEYGRLKDKKSKELLGCINDNIVLGEAALKALALPSTLEAFEVPLGLPKSILDKSNEVKKEGGTASILEMQMTLEALASKDIEILTSARKLINDEEREDDGLRIRFKDNWKRLPSSKLNQNLKGIILNFQEKLAAASRSDELLRKKIDDSLHIIESLCSSKEELEASIPSSSSNSTIGAKDPTVKLLRQLLDQLKACHNNLKEIEAEIKSFCSRDSIENALMEGYATTQKLAADPIFEKAISGYNTFIEKIEKSRKIQDSILQKIHEASSKFSTISNANRVISEREAAFSSLNSAFSLFMEIKSGLLAGIKFYSDFESILLKLEGNCSDFVFARNVDKKDVLEGLQQSISSMNLSSPTNVKPSAPSIEPGVWNGSGNLQYQNSNYMSAVINLQMDTPTELWRMIINKLPYKSDILSTMMVNKTLYFVGLPLFYRHIKVGPRIKEDAWVELVNALENGSYLEYIQHIDDVWLYVGAEVESNSMKRKDSGISIFPRFSLHYALDMIMSNSKSLKSLTLQFYSELTNQLPWRECLDRITTLDLRMRVNSYLCHCIFTCTSSTMIYLNLERAEIPDSSLILIAKSCPALQHISIHITELETRSRYHLLYEEGTSDLITDDGFTAVINNCPKLRILNIYPLIKVSKISDILKLQYLEEVSITLNAEDGITFSAINNVLLMMPDVTKAHIISGNQNNLASRVINEDELVSAIQTGHLTALRLLNMDFSKNIHGFPSYYGGISHPWMVADLKQRLSNTSPLINVLIEFNN